MLVKTEGSRLPSLALPRSSFQLIGVEDKFEAVLHGPDVRSGGSHNGGGVCMFPVDPEEASADFQ